MPSPFPGMDPWLEGEEFFRDLHFSLTFLLREALNVVLPKGYIAKAAELVWVDDELRREPDVALFGRDRDRAETSGGVAVLPGLLAIGQGRISDTIEEPYLEIVSTQGKRLVTAIEVVSLTNKKAGEKGRKSYQDKQEEYLLAGVNVVEIDLHRRGPHVTRVPLDRLRRKAGPFDYHISVAVAGNSGTFFHAAPIKLTDQLPAIGIPLDPDVSPVIVDLQPLLDRAYDTGRYSDEIRYDRPPDPPLTAEQQTWAEGILRAKGLLPERKEG